MLYTRHSWKKRFDRVLQFLSNTEKIVFSFSLLSYLRICAIMKGAFPCELGKYWLKGGGKTTCQRMGPWQKINSSYYICYKK